MIRFTLIVLLILFGFSYTRVVVEKVVEDGVQELKQEIKQECRSLPEVKHKTNATLLVVPPTQREPLTDFDSENLMNYYDSLVKFLENNPVKSRNPNLGCEVTNTYDGLGGISIACRTPKGLPKKSAQYHVIPYDAKTKEEGVWVDKHKLLFHNETPIEFEERFLM